jgi:CRP-like cAMP-binding protein
VTFPGGEAIFRTGEEADDFWILKKGKVVLKRPGSGGQEAVLDILTPKEAVIGVSALAGGPYAATAYAAGECLLLRVPAALVREAMRSSPELTTRLFALLVARIRHMEVSIAQFHDFAGPRILETLYGLSEKFGQKIPVTHRELAGMAGTSLETSIRTLSPLRAAGVLRLSRGQITILNKAKLRRMALRESTPRVNRRSRR